MPRGRPKGSKNVKPALAAGKTKVYRSYEDRIAEIDKKIQFHEDKIALLKTKKAKTRGANMAMSSVMKRAKDAGMSADEIAEKLGI